MNRLCLNAVLLYFMITNCFVLSIDEPVNDYTCQTDEDCAEKNVGNCCGYYPKCVNKDFEPDLDAVEQWCRESYMVSICGWPVIDACVCEEGFCKEGIVSEPNERQQGDAGNVISTQQDEDKQESGGKDEEQNEEKKGGVGASPRGDSTSAAGRVRFSLGSNPSFKSIVRPMLLLSTFGLHCF